MITILGPTASGKTSLAALLAHDLSGEIISADSRQVYKGMDLGTGKDYKDYIVKGEMIPVHLIDIAEPGYEYNIFEYQRDFTGVYNDILKRGRLPILCGGSGMYLEAVLKGYDLKKIRNDPSFRKALESKPDKELKKMLESLRIPHNTTDLTDRERMIRAVEIAVLYSSDENSTERVPEIPSSIFGIRFERETLRKRITERLTNRLQNGMIEEVQSLLDQGVTPEQLKFYGLEYRYVTQFLCKEMDFNTMFSLLNTAIHQFAKRQMTWFRRMERNGFLITWIDGMFDNEKKAVAIKTNLKK